MLSRLPQPKLTDTAMVMYVMFVFDHVIFLTQTGHVAHCVLDILWVVLHP